jgi:glycosyltransferase involved in cell wall biosynthesis
VISFIIVSRNEAENIALCLQGIEDVQGSVESEVILVDNGSDDDTVQIARKFQAKVEERDGGTIGSLRNEGASIADGDLLCFVDADVIIDPVWLNKLTVLLKDEKVAAVCGVEKWFGENPTWVEKAWLSQKFNFRKEVQSVNWSSSQAMIVKKSAFQEVGGFNQALCTCEDYDLGMRLSERYRILKCHTAFHRHLRPSKTVKQFYKRELWRGQHSLNGVFSHGIKPTELPSLVMPFVWGISVIALLSGGGILLFVKPQGDTALYLTAASLAVACSTLALMTVKNIKNMVSPLTLLQLACLNTLYLSARFFAYVVSGKRVTSSS